VTLTASTPASRRRPIIGWATAATIVAGIAFAGVLAMPTTSDTAPMADGTWAVVPDAPIAPRSEHAAVWTGTELVVWGGAESSGGGRVFADGAAYDPGTQMWRAIPDAPIGGRERSGAVWTGREVIVWGGDLGVGVSAPATGAAWDPATNRWRTIAAAPIDAVQYPSMLWTGTEVVVTGATAVAPHDAAAYDPVTGSWRVLDPLPVSGAPMGVPVWTGSHVVTTVGDPIAGLQVATLDPATGAWATSPVRPNDRDARPTMGQPVWTGDRLLVLALDDGGIVALAWQPGTGTWVEAGHAALGATDALDGRPIAVPLVWTGRLVVAKGLSGFTFEPGTETWRYLPSNPTEVATVGSTAVWTGDAGVGWGGTTSATPDGPGRSLAGGVAFRPGG
jgi:hypothetical protein